MTAAEFKDAKLLWKMFYAYHCFRRAEAAAQHIPAQLLTKLTNATRTLRDQIYAHIDADAFPLAAGFLKRRRT